MANFDPNSVTSGVKDSAQTALQPLFGSANAGITNAIQLPYQTNADLLRKIQEIKADRWNRLYQYSFGIHKADQESGKVNNIGTTAVPGFNKNAIALRIPPSSISINTQFASAVSATNRGILEENNGVVFRTIAIQGTTGIYPDRLVVGQGKTPSPAVAILKNLFPGTVQAIDKVITQAKNVANTVTGNTPPRELSPEDTPNNPDLQNTGYFQFWQLHNFFVAYAELKKKPDAQDFRLIFNSPKDNISYICTPVTFDLRRSAESPLLYRYNIILRAWDVVSFGDARVIDVLEGVPRPENVAALKAVTETLRQSRKTITAVKNVFSGVRSDFDSVLNVYNQAMMVLKDSAGVAEELADFPEVIKNSISTLVEGPTNSFIDAFNSLGGDNQSLGFDSADEKKSPNPGGNAKSSIEGAGGSSKQSSTTPDGETDVSPQSSKKLVASGAITGAMSDEDFNSMTLDDFPDIPDSILSDLDDKRTEAFELTTGDIRELGDNLQSVSDNFAESVGAADEVYNQTYGLSAPIEVDRVPTEDDIMNQVALQEARSSFDSTLATGQLFNERESDPFVQSNNNLDQSDQMASPLSAIPVPYQRGTSLELLATQYLGDSNRAREIALLNALRPPYIDEVGFTVPIELAEGRTFVIEDNDDIAINQVITIRGTGVASSRRRILNIESIGGSQVRIVVDGQDNLEMFAPATSPYLETRLPGTVGPGDVILIPSEQRPDNPISTRTNSIEERLSHAEKVFKIDLALDPKYSRDLVVSPNGDVKRAYGYDNALQALRLAVEIGQKELERHPLYGLAFPIGARNSDLTIADINEAISTTITNDPRFASAIAEVEIDGSVSRIRVNTEGAAGTGQIPVDFEVGKP